VTCLAVIVPCRNEAAVIARKLRNLAACRWPASRGTHHVLVVDDGSDDATAEIARCEAAALSTPQVRFEVLANDVRPGKPGAIERALQETRRACDFVILTDADVVLAVDALEELVQPLLDDARNAIATGAQRFVESLADSGDVAAAGGGELRADGSFYDWASACVRALESRAGIVFSVHGQLMAWPAKLDLLPTAGIAADDLDLMLQARVAGWRVVRAPKAIFFEVRAPRGEARKQQVIRRARAYHQFLRHPRIHELRVAGSWLARRQAALYLHAGRVRGPWTILALGSIFLAGWYLGPVAATLVAAVNALLFLPAWVLLRIVRSRMEIAEALEARSPMGERWETARR
jgi:glycosyltransferase involved in cell wall biosynthesis